MTGLRAEVSLRVPIMGNLGVVHRVEDICSKNVTCPTQVNESQWFNMTYTTRNMRNVSHLWTLTFILLLFSYFLSLFLSPSLCSLFRFYSHFLLKTNLKLFKFYLSPFLYFFFVFFSFSFLLCFFCLRGIWGFCFVYKFFLWISFQLKLQHSSRFAMLWQHWSSTVLNREINP